MSTATNTNPSWLGHPPPSRLRRGLKRAGLLSAAMLVAAIILSPHWAIGGDIYKLYLSIEQACLWVVYDEPEHFVHKHGWVARFNEERTWTPAVVLSPQFLVRIPLWMVLMLIGIPTALLWYRDWKVPPWLCPGCGYNLSGNTSGRCPECGLATQRINV